MPGYYCDYSLLRQNPDTANAGSKWSIEDDVNLRKYILENKSHDEIAFLFKRTLSSISSRVLNNIILPEYDGKNFSELITKYNIKDVAKFAKLTKMKYDALKISEEWSLKARLEDGDEVDEVDDGENEETAGAAGAPRVPKSDEKVLDEYQEYRIRKAEEMKQKRELKLSGSNKYHKLLSDIIERLDRIEKKLEGYDFTE